MELRYVREGKILMIEDEEGNKEIIDKDLKESFEKERIEPDEKTE